MSNSKTVIVIVPGSSLTPAHYGYLQHLFLEAGYGTLSALLPSTGTLNGAKVTIEDDTQYIRNHMVLPILENEKRDVVIFGHSYGGIPGSAAVSGLDKATRQAAGKSTAVIGQIYCAAAIVRGGDGNSVMPMFGGVIPPYLEESANIVRSTQAAAGVLIQDANDKLATAVMASTIAPSMTTYLSPVPRASWDEPGYDDHIAYIRTTQDLAVPVEGQDKMIESTGVKWIVKDIAASHSASLTHPVELANLVIALVEGFKTM